MGVSAPQAAATTNVNARQSRTCIFSLRCMGLLLVS
jgi:hypothetical protein